MVLLVDGEDGGVWHLGVLLLGDLLLAVEQEERLEVRRGVHLAERGPLGMIFEGWSRLCVRISSLVNLSDSLARWVKFCKTMAKTCTC